MDKRYQVFISSTFTDLVEERKAVTQTLMKMDCIPSGMESFPAADMAQLDFIKSVIDDCDYYILIIGARYGSVSAEGISYTELEYNYAKEKKINVIAFLQDDLENVKLSKTEKDPERNKLLTEFRAEVKKNRLVEHWLTFEDLQYKVSTSLH